MKRFVSEKKETPRMFKSDFLEFFSRAHWTLPLCFYIPIIAFMLWLSISTHSIPIQKIVILFFAGLSLWTLIEYFLHQFVFHYHPKSEWGKKLFWMLHGIHHDYPNDPMRLVMPPSISLPIAAAIFTLFYFTLGKYNSLPLMAGLTVGYLIYDVTHYAVHYFPLKSSYFKFIREHHLRHHFQDPQHGFGVSSPFWDLVFKTNFRHISSADERTQ
jgi:sterol desaturase/sphingolipid hydroxylase (fatty acid hydroxylase superfamily)